MKGKNMLVTLGLIGCLLTSVPPVTAQEQSLGRVVRDGAAIWRSDVSIIATTVREGTILQITAQSSEWYEVIIPVVLGGRGERGLIARSQVQLLPGSPEPAARPLRGDPAGASGTPSSTPPGSPPRAAFPRSFISVNGVYQATSNDFRDGANFQANAETGRFDADYTVKAGPALDFAAGATVGGLLAVGVSVSRLSLATPTHLNGSIPHPFFFDRARSVAGDAGGLKREELAVHVQARLVIPLGRRMQVMTFGGPSFFHVKQDIVTDFSYADDYPYDEASFKTATTNTRQGSKLGFNGGGDVAFFFSRQVGVGFTAQFSGATVPLKSAGGGNANVKAGGVQAGGGLRLRF